MMSKLNSLELKLTNYKKHGKREVSFEAGNLYLITGTNDIGKTSMLNALASVLKAKDNTKNPITFGETKGKVECIITNKKGEKTDIIVEYERSKTPKFKILYPDTKTSTKPTDIRNFAQFNDFTVDEFFSWGHTAEGRKKQAEVLLSIIQDKTIVQEIKDKSIEVSTKGKLYKERADANADVRVSEKLMNDNVLTDEEVIKLATLNDAKIQLAEYKERYQDLFVKTQGIRSEEEIETQIVDTTEAIERAEIMIKQLQEDIASGKAKLIELEKEKKQDNSKLLKEYEELGGSIKRGEEYIGSLSILEAKDQKYVSMKENYESATKKAQELTVKIEQYRTDIKDLFAKANYPVDNITIEDGEAYFIEGDNKIPFVESDLSYSKGGSKIVEILMELNKELPIILLGKASEYDKATKDKFADIAKDKGYIMIADSVVEKQDNLEVVVWDLKEKDISLSDTSPKEEPINDKTDNKLF